MKMKTDSVAQLASMRTIRFILLIATCGFQLRMSADQENSGLEIRFPTKVTLLSVPVGAKVRIRAGMFELSRAGQYSSSNLPEAVQRELKPGPANEFILDSPAVVDEYGCIDARSINNNNRLPTAVALVGGKVVAILEKRVALLSARKVETHFTVFTHDGEFRRIAEFKLVENPYNLCLDQAYAVSSTLAAILLRSSRHPYVNAIVLFDLSQAKVIGYNEFSNMRYLPKSNAIWMAQSVANCDNLTEAVGDAAQRAEVFPILKNGKLNSELSDTTEVESISSK